MNRNSSHHSHPAAQEERLPATRLGAKLDKILALCDSPHAGEALAALRALRTVLQADGASLAELLQRAVVERPDPLSPTALHQAATLLTLQREMLHLQQKNMQLQNEYLLQQREARHWRITAEQRNDRLSKTIAERDRLQLFLNDMAEKINTLSLSLRHLG